MYAGEAGWWIERKLFGGEVVALTQDRQWVGQWDTMVGIGFRELGGGIGNRCR